MRMAIKITTGILDELDCEGLVLGIFADERPPRGRGGFADWRLNGLVSRHLKEGRISGAYLEKVLIPSEGRMPAGKVLLIGLGRSEDLTYDQLYTAGYTISETISGVEWQSLALDIPAGGRCLLDASLMTEAMVTGLVDFCCEAPRWPVRSTDLLADFSYLNGVVNGLECFRKNARDAAANVDIFL